MVTYKDMREKYPWLKKNYPEVWGVSGAVGTVTKETYRKVGSRWKLAESETEHFNDLYYLNTFEAVPFFRRLGGYERVVCQYTTLGYIPTESVSISPDRETKIVRKFRFEERR